MPPKRPHDDDHKDSSGRAWKKAKTVAARKIDVQEMTAGPSTPRRPASNAGINGMAGLPTAIDVEKFTEARAFEIQAIESSMANAKDNATSRAFQAVPRHLRRRAASHDVRKLPVRLREKARAEMDAPKKKASRPKPKMGKSKRISRTESLQKRQIDKQWLETHIWHAKRMKMVQQWGYRLGEQPTEKAFRPSVRAAAQGSILHDASYFATVELKGKEKLIKSILNAVCDPQGSGPSARGYTSGARACDTVAYKPNAYPFDMICPMTVIWRPLTPLPGSNSTTTDLSNIRQGSKQQGLQASNLASGNDPLRTVWIRVHPAAFDEFYAAIQEGASLALEDHRKRVGEQEPEELEIADLRGDICSFEVMGPKSTKVIRGALALLNNEERKDFKDVWRELLTLQSTSSVPRGMILGMTVYDPRLHFPPKNAKSDKGGGSSSTPGTFHIFPSNTLARTDLWDEEIRLKLSKPRYQKKDLDSRRGQNLVPGTPLRATVQDDRVPIMLIQRSVGGLCNSEPDLHGWTILIPKGWGMAFLSSFVFTGPRVGGLRERRVQYFEAAAPCFPDDFVTSVAYDQHAQHKADEDKAEWERKPPAKRTNWEALQTTSPWKADWKVVLGLTSQETITTQRDDDESPDTLRPWLCRLQDTPSLFKTSASGTDAFAGSLLLQVNTSRAKRTLEPCNLSAQALLQSALVQVRIVPCQRGCPEDLAIIYSIDCVEANCWREALRRGPDSFENAPGEPSPASIDELSARIPEPSSIIGYVTTGNFSLLRGRGHAIGAVGLSHLFNLANEEHATGVTEYKLLVKIRDRHSSICRSATLEIAV